MIKTFLFVSALIASTASVAQDHIVVGYADLDLASTKGVERLEKRIEAAAWSLCRQGGRDSGARMAERVCRTDVLERARAQVRYVLNTNADGDVRIARRSLAAPAA